MIFSIGNDFWIVLVSNYGKLGLYLFLFGRDS